MPTLAPRAMMVPVSEPTATNLSVAAYWTTLPPWAMMPAHYTPPPTAGLLISESVVAVLPSAFPPTPQITNPPQPLPKQAQQPHSGLVLQTAPPTPHLQQPTASHPTRAPKAK